MNFTLHKPEIITFIKSEKKRAEKELAFREESERVWRDGRDAEWKSVGCKMTPDQRLKTSAIHGRIAVKTRRRIEFLGAILERLEREK